MTETDAVKLTNITKRFPSVLANDNINFVLKKGEIHALLGENGAGKTTLMNILYGLQRADSGTIEVYGRPVSIHNPNDALSLKIGMVHQHFMLFEPFTVIENIMLGREIHQCGVLDRKKARKKVVDLSESFGLTVDPDSYISEISVAMQQRVELLRILYQGADILILDEPTAVLSPQEIVEFGAILRKLVTSGKSVIVITHKLKEIIDFADRCTVVSRGKVVNTLSVSDVDAHALASMMIGHELQAQVQSHKNAPGPRLLSLQNIYAEDDRGHTAVQGVTLDVHAGEILALTGVDGNGQREIIEVLAGVRKASSGSILLRDQEIQNYSPRMLYESGCANIPEDRHKDGLVFKFTVAENIALRTYRNYVEGPFLRFDKMNHDAVSLIQDFNIYPADPMHAVGEMSGGNQQKVIIARELVDNPEFIVAAHPTRGLDVGAASYVQQSLVQEKERGAAILLISFDLDEILQIANRIAIIYNGKIIAVKSASDLTREQLGLGFAGIAE